MIEYCGQAMVSCNYYITWSTDIGIEFYWILLLKENFRKKIVNMFLPFVVISFGKNVAVVARNASRSFKANWFNNLVIRRFSVLIPCLLCKLKQAKISLFCIMKKKTMYNVHWFHLRIMNYAWSTIMICFNYHQWCLHRLLRYSSLT